MAQIYKRGSIYWARAQRAGREFRESLKTKNRRVAESRYQQWLGRLDALAWGDRERRTLAEAIDKFILEHLPTLKESSRVRYGISLTWLDSRVGSLFIDQIGRKQLSEFEGWRRGEGAKPPTIRRDLACLSSLLSSCEEWEWLEDGQNPVPGYLKRRAKRGLKEAPGLTRYLTEDEETALLAKAAHGLREAAILAIDTGLRREELFSLRWSQIDLRRGVIETTTNTKSGRLRKVPISQRAAQFLAQWRGSPRGAVASIFVFAHDDGRRYLQMNKGFKAALGRAGIEGVRWHDLRRTAGCRWLQRDRRSMEEVSVLLGHSSVAVTEKCYAFLDGERVAQEVAQSSHKGQRIL